MPKVMLTTIDNPYNPHEHWKEWLSYDESKGYFTNALLARVVFYSDDLPEPDQDLAIETAIDEIIKEDALLLYKKIYK